VGEHTYGFEKLHVWQNARRLVVQVYNVTGRFPKTETYSLVDQNQGFPLKNSHILLL